MQEILNYDDIIITSCDCSKDEHVSNCECSSCTISDTETDANPKKKIGGAKDTPTPQYWYEETEGFVVKKTDERKIRELADKIIAEYIRATSAETAINIKVDTAVGEIEENISVIEDVVTEVTTKVDEHTEKIENLETSLEQEEKKRIKNDERLEHMLRHEKKERIEVDKQIVGLIKQEVEERKNADKEIEEELSKYIDSEIDSINLKQDEENERKYYLYVGDEVHGEFTIPEDKYLNGVDYDSEAHSLTITVNEGEYEYKTFNVDLSDLNNVYTAGYGIVIGDDNVVSAKINEHNRFLTINRKGEIDFNVTITGGVEGDIWQYYLCGADGTIDSGDNTKIDLRPIKEYIDTSAICSKEYTDEKIAELREQIEEKLSKLIVGGDNIDVERNEEGIFKISVKIDTDMKDVVDSKKLLIDALPEKGDSLDAAIIKVLNNIVTNADTSDGEDIDFNSNEITF